MHRKPSTPILNLIHRRRHNNIMRLVTRILLPREHLQRPRLILRAGNLHIHRVVLRVIVGELDLVVRVIARGNPVDRPEAGVGFDRVDFRSVVCCEHLLHVV